MTTHRRDFLRENIMNLREIQRMSREKEAIKKQEEQIRSLKSSLHNRALAAQQRAALATATTATGTGSATATASASTSVTISDASSIAATPAPATTLATVAVTAATATATTPTPTPAPAKASAKPSTPTKASTPAKSSTTPSAVAHAKDKKDGQKSNSTARTGNVRIRRAGERIAQSISQHHHRIRTATKVGHRNAANQTDDIEDEIFLLSALKKHADGGKYLKSTTETHIVQKMLQEVQESYANAVQVYYANEQIKRKYIQQRSGTISSDEEDLRLLSVMSNPIQQLRDFKDGLKNPNPADMPKNPSKISKSLEGKHDFSELAELKNTDPYHDGEGGHREKEEDMIVISEMEPDPYCPFGYVVLSESERLKALQAARSQFNALKIELHKAEVARRTPVTTIRRAELEKEISDVESNIRIFSKPKVYVKREDMPLRS